MKIGAYFVSAVVSLIIVLADCPFPETADAAFFDMPGIGGRAYGMGGAMTALADDAVSAPFYNPAGLADIPGSEVRGGASVVYFPVEYKSSTGYKTKNEKISVAPCFGMSSDRFAPLYFGIGLYGSLGTGFDYDRDKRYGINYDFTSEMGNMYLSPTIGYRITDTLSIGAGLNITYGKIEMGMPIGTRKLSIDVDGFCYGVNLGVLYKPCKYINLGLRWRSRMRAELKGDAEFRGVEDDVTAYMYWPDLVTFGLAVHAFPKFRTPDLKLVTI